MYGEGGKRLKKIKQTREIVERNHLGQKDKNEDNRNEGDLDLDEPWRRDLGFPKPALSWQRRSARARNAPPDGHTNHPI